jgi:hypothetical protein
MRGWIIRSQVRFHFDNSAGEEFAPLSPDQDLPQQFRTDQSRIAIVERAWKRHQIIAPKS